MQATIRRLIGGAALAAAFAGAGAGLANAATNTTPEAPANNTTTTIVNQASAHDASTFTGSNGQQFRITLAANRVYGPNDAAPPNRPAPPGYHWVPGHGMAGGRGGMQWLPAYLAPN